MIFANILGNINIEDLMSLSIITDVVVPVAVGIMAMMKITKEIRETRQQNNRNFESTAARGRIQVIRETYGNWIGSVFEQVNYPSLSTGSDLANIEKGIYISKNNALINNYQTQLFVLFNPFVPFEKDILVLIRAIIGSAGHNMQVNPNMHNYRLLLNDYISNYVRVQNQQAELEMQWSKNTKTLTQLQSELETQINNLVNETMASYSIQEAQDKLAYIETIKQLEYVTITNYEIDPKVKRVD